MFNITVRSLTKYLRQKFDTFSICSIIDHCTACSDILSFTRALTLAFGSDFAAKFGARLFEAFKCHRSGAVDCFFIVVMYKALVYAKLAYRNPRSIFLKLLEEYTNGDVRCEYKKIEDIIKIACIASVTKVELDHTSGLLQHRIIEICGDGEHLTIPELENVLDSCPSVLDHFRFQLMNQMPAVDKIELLYTIETESLGTFIKTSQAIGVKRMYNFKMRRLLRLFAAWRKEVDLSLRLTKRRKMTALSLWQVETRRLKMFKLLEEISVVSYYKSLTRRNFIRWRRLVSEKIRIQRICISEDIDKDVRQASGHLRIFAKKYNRRVSYFTWKAFTLKERRYEEAKQWQERKTTRLTFLAFRKHCSFEIQKRKRNREATIIQQKALLQRQQKSLEIDRSNHRKKLKWKPPSSKNILSNTQNRQLDQKDIEILKAQRDMRRKRVDDTKRNMEEAFKVKWLNKQAEFDASIMQKIESWMLTADYKCKCEDQEKKYKTILSDAGDEDAERAMSSNEVICFSILDGMMTDAQVVPNFIYESLPDPFDVAAFKSTLEGVKNLDATQAEKLFQGMTTGSNSVSKQRLFELQQLSHQYIGKEGSRWKTYICSTTRRIQLHNISSGQKVISIKKKHIRRVVKENLRSCEVFKGRSAFLETKRKAHEFMWEHHAAKVIQNMFRRWKGRQRVKAK